MKNFDLKMNFAWNKTRICDTILFSQNYIILVLKLKSDRELVGGCVGRCVKETCDQQFRFTCIFVAISVGLPFDCSAEEQNMWLRFVDHIVDPSL